MRKSLAFHGSFVILAVAFLMLLAGCTAGTPQPTADLPAATNPPAADVPAATIPPSAATEPAAATAPPATETIPPTVAPTLDGEALLNERCTACHGLSTVTREKMSAEKWGSTLTRMVNKGAVLNDTEKAVLLEYLAKTYAP